MRTALPRTRPLPVWLLVFVVLLAAALSACMPRIAPAGPGGGPPALAGDALRTGGGLRLPMRKWLSPDQEPEAVILALHGFNDYSMAFDSPASWMANQGYAVYAYDQRGFGGAPHRGLWGGTGRMVGDFGTAVALLRERYPDTPVFALGSSMGGAVILAAAGRGVMPDLDGVILAAPAVWARETMPFYQRWALWVSVRTVPWMTLTGSGLGVQASDNITELRALGTDPKVIKATRIDAMQGLTDLMGEALAAGEDLSAPALVMYGEKDEIVPSGPTLRLWRQFEDSPAVTTALYADGWHMLLRDLQGYTVWRDIEAWIEAEIGGGPERGRALPSRAGARAGTALALGRIPLPKDVAIAPPPYESVQEFTAGLEGTDTGDEPQND